MTTLYLCDPEKNVTCKKTNCYVNGGPCKSTDKLNFAKQPLTTVTLVFDVSEQEFKEITEEVDSNVKQGSAPQHGKKRKGKSARGKQST